MEEKKAVLYTDVIKRFQNEERDFSGIRLVVGNFDNLDLEGISFKNSILIGPTFRHANLKDADFSDAKLEFCSFFHATLINATFQNARIEATGFGEANLENTNFDNTELYWTPFMESNYSAAKLKNAKFIKVAFTWSEITENDIEEAIRIFGARAKEELPIGRATELVSGAEATLDQLKALKLAYGTRSSSRGTYSSKQSYTRPDVEEDPYTIHLKQIIYALFGDSYDLDKKTSKSYKR